MSSVPAADLGRRRRGLVLLAAALAAVSTGATLQLTRSLGPAEQATVDARFAVRGAQPTDELAVVAVDDVTFSDLGEQWPFPRSLHAQAVDRLREAGARAIVLDVQFTEPTTPPEDLALFDAIDHAGGAVLATSESDERGRTKVLGGDENLAEIGAVAGASNMPDEHRGVVRRVTPAMGRLPTLAVRTAERLGRPPAPGAFAPGGALIDFRGGPGTIATVPFSTLLAGRADPAVLRDRIVVVGASAPTLHDLHPTPTTGERLMSGPEVQANAIWTVLHGLPLRSAPPWAGLLAIVLLGVAVPLAALRLRPLRAALVGGALALAALAGAQAAFAAGLVVPVVVPLLALAVGTAATVAASLGLESRERRRVAQYSALLEATVRERTAELRATELEVLQRLGQAVELRDGETGEHVRRMSELSRRLALAAGWSEADAELLHRASALHDVGKLAVPDRILSSCGTLDAEDRARMREHTTIGGQVLAGSRAPLVRLAHEIALTHHERWDGGGYPAGLAGEEIPVAGRICAIADVFDALTSQRPYKASWSPDEAVEEIVRQRGRQFDPWLVDVFAAAVAPALRREAAAAPAVPALRPAA
jgi:CHASE2 domain-containing sensor protein